jgi:hypothetical protein
MFPEARVMKGELRFLNLLCFLAALLFLAAAVANGFFAGQFLTTDNLFITLVCLVMAVVFAAIPLLQMKDEGRLPIPFKKRIARRQEAAAVAASSSTPVLDARGRAIPPDVRAMLSNMRPPSANE